MHDECDDPSEMFSFWNMSDELSTSNLECVEVISSLEPGSHFGNYRVIAKLGSGGMGAVYKVYDTRLNKEIALKLIISADKASQESTERFLREAKTTAILKHPYIVQVYDIGHESGQPYFSMELVEGISLKDFVKTNRCYQKVMHIFGKICEAMHYAHRCGVIHRDLKPDNIMIRPQNDPCIMDFGLAKTKVKNKKISHTGMVMGTLQYMAPEQAQGLVNFIDERSDIYSLGCILHYLLVGRPPFIEKGVYSFHFMYQILAKKPALLSVYRNDVPQKLQDICLKALAKDKESRYQTVAQILYDLKKVHF
ncbi:serine/threonine-protein kinase [Candidatus Uabimicrobium amorphum]|uniref:non-specific serine/threonine protein kinase n=1 Tax=Uabimicrobium amorphum TaxID=2596890 RepID=A0A5S9ILQ5_UABAM|nr:serine/threonine-protein kinase [Candidatus Uabimicrobium amorphum]BBM84208.1 serine/threonine-protein kinase PknB [Candidatus Uabimicrobium amorphum]